MISLSGYKLGMKLCGWVVGVQSYVIPITLEYSDNIMIQFHPFDTKTCLFRNTLPKFDGEYYAKSRIL